MKTPAARIKRGRSLERCTRPFSDWRARGIRLRNRRRSFQPTSFAGLFGAAPSVALATLALAISKDGKAFAGTECRSMMAGAAGLCLYSILVSQLLSRFRLSALMATLSAMPLCFLTAFGLWRIFLTEALTMTIKIDPSGLTQTKWHEYALRFVAGGIITVLAGVIARKGGPGIGGLFLAFPAIFPASATLIEKHERQRKQRRGLHGEERGTDAAAIDALGTAIGSVGLIGCAGICWRLIPRDQAPLALGGATCAWLLVSFSIWTIRQWRRRLL